MPRNSVQSTNFPSFSPSKTAKTLKVESLLNECEQQSSSLWDGILAQANDKVSVAPSIFVDVTPWVILSCSVLVLLKESSSNSCIGGGGGGRTHLRPQFPALPPPTSTTTGSASLATVPGTCRGVECTPLFRLLGTAPNLSRYTRTTSMLTSTIDLSCRYK